MHDEVMHPTPTAAGSSTRDYVDRTLLHVLAAMPPGWTVLQEAVLPEEDGAPPTRISNVLVHPDTGIAVLDVVPGPTVNNAAARLRRLLETTGFAVTFGGVPPVIHLCMPLRTLPELGTSLDQAFGRLPLLIMHGGGAWVAALQRLLAATPLTAPKNPAVSSGGRLAMGRAASVGRRGRPWHPPGLRALAGFWAGLALVAAGGVAALQYLGPPAEPGGAERRELAAAEVRRHPAPDASPESPPGTAAPSLLIPALPVQSQIPPPMPSLPAMPGPSDIIAALPVSTPEPAWPLGPVDAMPGPERTPDRASSPGEMASTEPPRAASSDPIPAMNAAAEPTVGSDMAPAPLAVPPPDDAIAAAGPAARREPDPALVVPALPEVPLPAEVGPIGPPPVVVAPALPEFPSPAQEQAWSAGPSPVPTALPPLATIGAAQVAGAALPTQVPPAGAPPSTTVAPALGAADGPSVAATTPPSAVARPAGASASPSVNVEALVRRADAMMALNDVSAARLLYGRAAAAGSGQAMLALGKIHDPLFLGDIGARGIPGDTAVAVAWYRRAVVLGVGEARERLALHGVTPDE